MEHMRIHSGQLARCRAETESCEHSPSGHATSDSKKKVKSDFRIRFRNIVLPIIKHGRIIVMVIVTI